MLIKKPIDWNDLDLRKRMSKNDKIVIGIAVISLILAACGLIYVINNLV